MFDVSKNDSPETKLKRLGRNIRIKDFSTNLLERNHLLVLLQIHISLSTPTCNWNCICHFLSNWIFMSPFLIYLPCNFWKHKNMLIYLCKEAFGETILIRTTVKIQAILKMHKRSHVSIYIPTTPHCWKTGRSNWKV